MQHNKNAENLFNVAVDAEDQYQLSEASEQQQAAVRRQKKQESGMKSLISGRLATINNAFRSRINPSVGAAAITNFYRVMQLDQSGSSINNPKNSNRRLKPYDALRRLSRTHADAFTRINSLVPVEAIVQSSSPQFRRIVRDSVIRKAKSLSEHSEILSEEFQPPAMIMLKRQAIRQFPDGQRVVLYTDTKYGLTFTVPYDARGNGFTSINIPGVPSSRGVPYAMMSEETSALTLSSGDTIAIDNKTENLLEKVHSLLNEENKSKMINMLIKDKESFDRIIKFASNYEENNADRVSYK